MLVVSPQPRSAQTQPRESCCNNIVIREYWRLYWIEAERTYKENTDGDYQAVSDVSFPDEFLGNLMFQAIKKFDSQRIQES